MAKRIGFILYDNRSGSTLLSALLDRYPSISVSPETDRIAEILEADRAPLKDARGKPRGPAPQTIDGQLHRTIGEICDSGAGITHQLIKGPRLHFHLAALSAAFPDCLFVQIVRDGRAVFDSKRRTRSPAGAIMDDNLVHAAWSWRRKLEIAAPLDDRLLTIRYEELVRDPDATVQRTLDFLGVGRDDRQPVREVIDFYRDKVPESHRHLHSGLERPVSADLIDSWRSHLSPHEVLLYELENAASLAHYGYPLHWLGRRPPVGVRWRAEWLRFVGVTRWGLRLTSTALRYCLSPWVLMRKIRRTYDEFKALRWARNR